ncbi:MAG: FAD-dependent oxidoreductase [Thermodesulfovibrionales bacterium]|jgi:NADPH-dependent 2,4-dienoyl-CoA reductase/sulfur reductase-like enzyme
MKVVIIGSSAAGLACLDTLIRFSPELNATIISEEAYAPYCRCLLTYYLGGILKEKQMVIRDITSYPPNTTFLFGERVDRINTKNKSVMLAGGKEIPYDKLLIATGSNAVKPKYYDETKKTFTLRYMGDAKKIEPHIRSRVIVLGGGFVGIKAAFGLMQRNVGVTIVISSGYPLSMIVDEKTGSFIGKDLRGMGIDIRTGEDIAGIKTKDEGLRVSLSSGFELDSDAIIVGKGVKPRVELAKQAGIKTDLGITVNEFLETSAEGIYAAGDCCETMDIARKRLWVNAIWPVAVEQGYYAALNMLGMKAPYYGSVGMNSMKTRAFHLITAGVLKGGEGISLFEKYIPSKNQFRKLAVRDNVPVGMAFYNNPEEAGVIVNLIKKGTPLTVDPAKIVNNEVSMMDILKPL